VIYFFGLPPLLAPPLTWGWDTRGYSSAQLAEDSATNKYVFRNASALINRFLQNILTSLPFPISSSLSLRSTCGGGCLGPPALRNLMSASILDFCFFFPFALFCYLSVVPLFPCLSLFPPPQVSNRTARFVDNAAPPGIKGYSFTTLLRPKLPFTCQCFPLRSFFLTALPLIRQSRASRSRVSAAFP